ncbi:MAG: ATP-dependent helicase [Methanobacteriaceae archaeon]
MILVLNGSNRSIINLDDDQRAAVEYNGLKPLLIEACPGAGKTRVLTERVKFLLNNKKIAPESVLVITFSNKSANELKERLINSPGIDIDDIEKMQVSTIHSFCYTLLTEYGTGGITILDEDLAERTNMFIRKHIYDLGFHYESYMSKREIKNVIEKFNEYGTFKVDSKGLINYIKTKYPVSLEYKKFINSCIDEASENNKFFSFPYEKVKGDTDLNESWYNAKYLQIAKAYSEYLGLLDINDSIDFAHLQINALNLLKETKGILDKLKYKNILVDEFQDTDPIQMGIFELLMNNAESFTVVGDDDQSIYGFRGSNIDFFTEFESNYNAKVIPLKTNYRSSNNIVAFTEEFIKNDRREGSNKVLSANNYNYNNKNNYNPNNPNTKSNNLSDDNNDKNNNCGGNVFSIINSDKPNEADNLIKVILDLKENGKIQDYSDIAILFRSIGGMGKSKIESLLNEFKRNDIPYYIRGNPDLIKQDEIKIIIALIYYLIDSSKNNHILTSWEKDWLNLKIYNLLAKYGLISNETGNILSTIWEKFQQNIIDMEKVVYKEFECKNSRISTFSGVFKRGEYILVEIFNRVKKPVLSEINLSSLGIKEEDLEFFNKLNKIKSELSINDNNNSNSNSKVSGGKTNTNDNTITDYIKDFNMDISEKTDLNYNVTSFKEDGASLSSNINLFISNLDSLNEDYESLVSTLSSLKNECESFISKTNSLIYQSNVKISNDILEEEKESITLLGAFYKILETMGYLNDDFVLAEENKETLENLAILTNTLYNYENIIDKNDFKGLFYFLYHNLENYSSSVSDEKNAVQIMTVHKAKGLEFPVVILASLEDDKFPMKYKEKSENKKGIFNMYYTPNEFLEYRENLSVGETEEEHNNEEKRVIYVAMTRAESILILSAIEDLPMVFNEMDIKIDNLNLVDFDNSNNLVDLPYLNIKGGEKTADPLDLSYTSINNYDGCPFKYNLLYNFSFKISDSQDISYGVVVHEALDKIHKLALNSTLTNEDVKQIAINTLNNYLSTIDKEDYDLLIENVLAYWDKLGKDLDIIGSEIPFSIRKEKYNLSGKIDLIYKKDGGIGIIDFKNSDKLNEFSATKQLITYILALADKKGYKDYKVNEIAVYTLKTNKLHIINFDDSLINKISTNIDKTADSILSCDFSKKESNFCEFCDFEFICR